MSSPPQGPVLIGWLLEAADVFVGVFVSDLVNEPRARAIVIRR